MSDHPSVHKYARKTAVLYGMEVEDLEQVGRMACARVDRAVESGQYDPRKASINTYTTWAVYNACRSAASRHRRKSPPLSTCELDENLADDRPPPDRKILLGELIRELPEDARAVVDLVLGDELAELASQVLSGARGAADAMRSEVRRILRLRRGDHARDVFDEISVMLREIDA